MRAIVDKMHELTSLEEEEQVASANPRVPIIMGDFTNWKPKPMYDVVDYCESF